MSSNCESCLRLLTRMQERQVHTERLKRDLRLAEENLSKLSTTCTSLQYENEFLETKLKQLEEEVQKNASIASERERLLDVINKDRDECLQLKMKVARYYRKALKKKEQENELLRKENEKLKNAQNLINSDEEREYPLMDVINSIRIDRKRNAEFLSKLDAAGRHMEAIIKKVSDLEISMKKQIPRFSGSDDQMTLLEDRIKCSCNQVHETLDDMFLCAEKNEPKPNDMKEITRMFELDQAEEADDEQDNSLFGW